MAHKLSLPARTYTHPDSNPQANAGGAPGPDSHPGST